MSAFEMIDVHLIPGQSGSCVDFFNRICRDSADGSGAADHDHSLLLRVEVEEDASAYEACVKTVGACESLFLVYREERFERSVHEVGVDHGGHGGGAAETVVSAESGAVGANPVAVDYCSYRVAEEVMVHAASFFRHHVLMALEHDSGSVLMSRVAGQYITTLPTASVAYRRLWRSAHPVRKSFILSR